MNGSASPGQRGFFAFPPDVSRAFPEDRFRNAYEHYQKLTQDIYGTRGSSSDTANPLGDDQSSYENLWRERQQREAEQRRKREEEERRQADAGEKDWVRSGGTVRDANGKRDMKRTEELKRIILEEKIRAMSLKKWDDYEAAWTILLKSNDEVTFTSIPWPSLSPPKSVEDLNQEAISDFLYDSLHWLDGKVTRKDRLRASLLRWHPDKLHSIVNRAKDGQADIIKEGIQAVTQALLHLQGVDKANTDTNVNDTPYSQYRTYSTQKHYHPQSQFTRSYSSQSNFTRQPSFDYESVKRAQKEDLAQALKKIAEALDKLTTATKRYAESYPGPTGTPESKRYTDSYPRTTGTPESRQRIREELARQRAMAEEAGRRRRGEI